jgi:polyisoprenoid-binding protein YceI
MALFKRTTKDDTMNTFDAPETAAIADLTGNYVLDVAHTRLGFSARHAMVTTVRGSFGEFEGTAKIDAADPTKSSVEIRLKVASITTGQQQRDEHLRSSDFLEIEKYPEIVFRSTAVEQVDDETATITGDLTIKDVTRPISIDFTITGSAKDPFGNLRAGFEGSTTINRTDWGLTWNAALETGGVLVSDKVKLEFDVSAIQQVSASA